MPPSCRLVYALVPWEAGITTDRGPLLATGVLYRYEQSMSDKEAETVLTEAAPLNREGWLSLLASIGDQSGSFEALGDRHWALFNEDSTTLLVSFDSLETICAGKAGQLPFTHDLATQNGWSHLAILAEGETWFRDADVFAYFDRLVDDCFFDAYDHVVFYGAGMGAYAACAFSVTSPGATVLALQARATLDPAKAGWDSRDRKLRRLNFTKRYGYAPDMTEGAAEVFLLFDPNDKEDAMHAALFSGRHVKQIRLPLAGPSLTGSLTTMKILPKMLRIAMGGKLTPAALFGLWRARRDDAKYLHRILATVQDTGHPQREAMICRSVLKRLRAPAFRRHLQRLRHSGALTAETPDENA